MSMNEQIIERFDFVHGNIRAVIGSENRVLRSDGVYVSFPPDTHVSDRAGVKHWTFTDTQGIGRDCREFKRPNGLGGFTYCLYLSKKNGEIME